MNDETRQSTPRVPDADAIARFRERPGVWLTFAGAAVYQLYRSRLVPIGVKPGWVTAMAIIEQRPNITQSALGRELRINRASAMATCMRMEDAGLVIRTPLKGRNQTGLCLSVRGVESLGAACAIEAAMIDQLLEGVAKPEREALVDLLRLITTRTAHPGHAMNSSETQSPESEVRLIVFWQTHLTEVRISSADLVQISGGRARPISRKKRVPS